MEENKKLLVGTDLKEVLCPLMGEIVDYGICFDISMVAEDSSPERFAPKRATSIPDFKDICLKCQYHRFD